ncbi:hypothetical protein [Sphingomonas glacialis]|uniref:hypothetical protein n=1 Tax=Sphingomonas glacialis TaxID=658225 RepID=UPI00322046D7
MVEVRAGIFGFFDLAMAGIGVCCIEDIALSVLATGISHQHNKGWILADAGWMAMARDCGAAKHEVDQGYGLVCDLSANPYRNVIVSECSLEPGIMTIRPGSLGMPPDLAIGRRARNLPNHSCATGAQHDRYHVVNGSANLWTAIWPHFGGW